MYSFFKNIFIGTHRKHRVWRCQHTHCVCANAFGPSYTLIFCSILLASPLKQLGQVELFRNFIIFGIDTLSSLFQDY